MARSSDKPARGADLRIDLALTFEEAAEGCERVVDIAREEPCGACDGTGLAGKIVQCPTCAGLRRVKQPRGFSMVDMECQACNGVGKLGDQCPACLGWRRVNRVTPTAIKIPAGVDHNNTMRIAKQGADGPAGPGDLWVVMTVAPHPRFTRRGDDLHVDVTIAKTLATSGGRATVPLLQGEHEVDVPANTVTGDTLVLRGFGIQKVGAPPTPIPMTGGEAPYRELDTRGRGDLVVTWKLDEPRGFFGKRSR